MSAPRIAAIYGRTSKEADDAYSVSSQLDAGLFFRRNTTSVSLRGARLFGIRPKTASASTLRQHFHPLSGERLSSG